MIKNKTKRIDIRFDEDQVELMIVLRKRFGIKDTPKLIRYAIERLRYTPAPVECPGIKDISKKIVRLDRKLDRLRCEEITRRVRSGKGVSKHARLLSSSFLGFQTKEKLSEWESQGCVLNNKEIYKALAKMGDLKIEEATRYDDWIQGSGVEEQECWSQAQVLEEMGVDDPDFGGALFT